MRQLRHQADILDEIVDALARYRMTLGCDEVKVCGECQRIKFDEVSRPHYNRYKSVSAMMEKIQEWAQNDHFPEGEPSFLQKNIQNEQFLQGRRSHTSV